MKKQKLRGFSLAELLIAMGIIAVIATMGISIGKKGIERAYNQYFYTAYNGLYEIFSDVHEDQITLYDNLSVNKCPTTTFSDYLKAYGGMTTGSDVQDSGIISYTGGFCSASFKAMNGVVVGIAKTAKIGDYIYVPMLVSIPAPNNKKSYFELFYFPNDLSGIIMPSPTEDSSKKLVSLQNRPDLLPFYIDDGKSGRIVNLYSTDTGSYVPGVYDAATDTFVPLSDGTFNAFKYHSFKTAYCNSGKESITGMITCTSSGSEEGAIRAANPRKVL